MAYVHACDSTVNVTLLQLSEQLVRQKKLTRLLGDA